MPYIVSHYTTGSTTLPFTLLDGRYDISTSADSPTPTTPLPNGEYDEYGDDRAPRRAQTVKIEETYLGSGYNTAIKAWKAVHRTKGRLYRQDDETGDVQWTPARLKAIPITRTVENAVLQGIALNFFLPDPLWFGEHHGGIPLLWDTGVIWDTGNVWDEAALNVFTLTSSGTTVVSLVNNGDETVENGQFIFEIGDAPVMSLHIVQATLGIDFTWDSTQPGQTAAAPGTEFVIDTGAQRITNNAVGAYGGFVRNAGHTVDQPIAMPVPPGGASYSITLVGGGAPVTTYMRPDYSNAYA